MNGIKKIFANKNTVTVVGIVLVIVVLYFSYNYRVNQATNPITVPYARKTINPGTQITSDMIGTIKVPPSMIVGEVITKEADVIDKYSSADSVIPEGSLFYGRSVVDKEQLPANIILDIKKGEILYELGVDMRSTYGNSIYPGNYIDIFVKIRKSKTSDTAMYLGRLLENVKVLAVKDANGKPVFENVDEDRVPAMIFFALPEKDYYTLKRTEYMGTYSAEIIIIPTNNSLETNPGEINISDKDLEAFILRESKGENIKQQ